MLSAALEFKLNKLISKAFDDLFGHLADPIPFDCFAHTNKKVGRNAHSGIRTGVSI